MACAGSRRSAAAVNMTCAARAWDCVFLRTRLAKGKDKLSPHLAAIRLIKCNEHEKNKQQPATQIHICESKQFLCVEDAGI